MTSRQRTSEFRTDQIFFVGQQDGPTEREFTSRLIELFNGTPNVRAAYLARIRYADDGPIRVALCLRLHDADDIDPVASAGFVFAEMFGDDNQLDIVPIDANQEELLSRVCSRFYPYGSSTSPQP
jgi:hypothetical protein